MTTPQIWELVVYRHNAGNLRTVKAFLDRSGSVSLYLDIQFVVPYTDSNWYRFPDYDEKNFTGLVQFVELIRPHLSRVRSLRFEGSILCSPIFPIREPLPQLRQLYLQVHPGRGENHFGNMTLFHSSAKFQLDALRVASWPARSTLNCVEPKGLRSLTLLGSWPLNKGIAFLSQCSKLETLDITLQNTGHPKPVSLPSLHSLTVRGSANYLPLYFSELAQLVHLTMICGRFEAEDNERFDKFRGASYNSAPLASLPWPGFPQLLSLTVDHYDIAEILPMILSSTNIQRMHFHAQIGFDKLLSFLLSDGSLQSDDSQTCSDILPALDLLRLWPREIKIADSRLDSGTDSDSENGHPENPAADHDQFSEHTDPDSLLPYLDTLLETRPYLDIEVGAVPPAMHDDYGGTNWRTAWPRSKFAALEEKFDGRLDVWDKWDDEGDWYAGVRLGYVPLPDTFMS